MEGDLLKTVLIVDDDALCMKLFKNILQAHDFATIHSVDGMDTLQLAREKHPDLIIMDIQLPKISGLEHVKMLKADDDLKRIPIIAVTGFAMVGDKKNILKAGCDAYISKPISIPNFLDEVKKFLAMGPFRLTASLVTGHAQVDAEHDQLGALLNQFMDFLEEGDSKGCEETIKKITNAINNHFEHEEEIMLGLGYNGIEFHKEEHIKVKEKYATLVKNSEVHGYGGDFASALTSVLVHDMIIADMDFKNYLEKINYKERAA